MHFDPRRCSCHQQGEENNSERSEPHGKGRKGKERKGTAEGRRRGGKQRRAREKSKRLCCTLYTERSIAAQSRDMQE